MRILQITNKIPYPPKDGGAIATLNISLGLAKLGHSVTILGMNTSKHYFDLKGIPEDIAQKVRFFDVKVNTNISFWAATVNLLFSDKPYNAERFFNTGFSEKLTDILNRETFDVIQLEGLYMAYYIDIVRKHSKALISLRAHNIEHEIWERTAAQEKSFLKRFYVNLLAKRIKKFKYSILNKYDILVPITQRDARQYQMFGNRKPFLAIPAGFDTSTLIPDPEKISFPSVFYIGTLDWFPNQEGLVWFLNSVWPKLRVRHPDLIFHVAGRNAPEWIKSLFQSHPNVNYLGEIDDAYSFMKEKAIMIVPLFSGSGMRVKIIEGMALGKTILTTSIGAEGIDVTHEKNIFIVDNENDFLESINRLIADRKLFDTVGVEARAYVREYYDNDKVSASLATFYLKQL